MKIWWWYLIVVGVVALTVALFEVWGIAHYHVGWGEPLPQNTTWGKPLISKAPFDLIGFQLLTRYHFFMYGILVPVVVLLLGILLRQVTASPPVHWFGWLTFTAAATLGVMVLEDFLFFVFSTIFGTPYPQALARMLRGEASWHPNQINFFGLFKLPAAYIFIPPVAALLIWVVSRFEL